MVGEISKAERSPLLPLRHQEGDFFLCDIFDAAPKGDMGSMEHPIFSLATKPDHRERRYERGNIYVRVRPGPDGLATVHDRDVLIYCISQVMAALNQGRKVSRTLRFTAFDLLAATNRQTNGQAYAALKSALQRLQSTQIETNITTGGIEQIDIFSLIDRVRVVRETREGRMLDLEITLSDWVFNAIAGNEVLTLNRRYFQLRKPLERRLYELARKHCGRQAEWRVGLDVLQEKTGSGSTAKEFKRLISKIIKDDQAHDHMPDYSFSLEAGIVLVRPKPEFTQHWEDLEGDTNPYFFVIPPLRPATYEKAKRAAPGHDVYALEQEWRDWATEMPRNPDAAFIGFCGKVAARRSASRH